jgi:hypothetical protein
MTEDAIREHRFLKETNKRQNKSREIKEKTRLRLIAVSVKSLIVYHKHFSRFMKFEKKVRKNYNQNARRLQMSQYFIHYVESN